MGEEVKKPEEAQKEKSEKPAAAAAEEETKSEKPAAEEKKKSEEAKAEEKSPPPPPEIVLKVYMHCEGCARKVRRCLKGFEGVEDVITDCRTSKVVVIGEKADPVKVLDRIQRKSHRQVQLISPIPKPPAEEPKKPEEKIVPKVEEKKEEPVVITVVMGVYMHCEACAQEIKKRIMRMKGVESAEPDIKSSQVKVKGVFEPEKLVEYLHKRTGKHATIVKVEPEKKEEEEKAKEGKEDKKPKEGGEEKESKKGGDDEANKESKEGGESGGGPAPPAAKPEAEDNKLELKKNEFYHYYPENHQVYPQRFVQEYYAYPPQIFSDENPNACSVM